jgi:hypothetical protein
LSDTLDNVFGIGCVVWILLLFGREKWSGNVIILYKCFN